MQAPHEIQSSTGERRSSSALSSPSMITLTVTMATVMTSKKAVTEKIFMADSWRGKRISGLKCSTSFLSLTLHALVSAYAEQDFFNQSVFMYDTVAKHQPVSGVQIMGSGAKSCERGGKDEKAYY